MKNGIAITAVAATLSAVGFFAGLQSPATKDLAAARDESWMNDVAHDAMRHAEQHFSNEFISRVDGNEDVLKKAQTLGTDRIPSVEGPRISDRFPNTDLIDQHGRKLKFYDDLVKDKSVCIVFF